MKKIIASVATLGLSLGIVSAAGAEELSTSTSPFQGNTTIETTSTITPYNLTKSYSEQTYYAKSTNPYNSWPESKRKTLDDANGKVWIGTLYISKVTATGNGWYVTYSGTLTQY